MLCTVQCAGSATSDQRSDMVAARDSPSRRVKRRCAQSRCGSRSVAQRVSTLTRVTETEATAAEPEISSKQRPRDSETAHLTAHCSGPGRTVPAVTTHSATIAQHKQQQQQHHRRVPSVHAAPSLSGRLLGRTLRVRGTDAISRRSLLRPDCSSPPPAPLLHTSPRCTTA